MPSENPWDGLGPTTEEWSVRRWPGLPAGSPLYAGRDSRGVLSLLVRSRGDAGGATAFATRALECGISELSVDGLPNEEFLVLRCRDTAFNELFRRLGNEVALVSQGTNGSPVEATLRVLARWKRFWTNESGLTEEAAVGLFGELWFLLHWLGGPTQTTLDAWRGPANSIHDFQFPAFSVEVKATASKGPLVHHIAGLQQLEAPSTGRLFLFSLHLVEDALAANELGALIDQVRSRCRQSEHLLDALDSRLADVGYRPSDQPSRSFRVLTEGLFEVLPDFPRLAATSFKNGVPAGITGINYELVMAACGRFQLSENAARKALVELSSVSNS